ncbi:MAG: hypothetical protein ACLSVD_17145 [Eggerthellaceae bacterium]
MNDGASSAVSGANQLDDGAAQLVDGVQAAKNGAGQLVSGAKRQGRFCADRFRAVQLEEGSGTLAGSDRRSGRLRRVVHRPRRRREDRRRADDEHRRQVRVMSDPSSLRTSTTPP